MASPSTSMDALLAELLGDVGRVHDDIKGLPDAIAPIAGAIVQASSELQQQAAALSHNAKEQHDAHARQVVAAYADRIGSLIEQRIDDAISARIGRGADQLANAIARVDEAAEKVSHATRAPWLALGNAWFVAGFIGIAGGIAATVTMLYVTGFWSFGS